MKLVTFKASGKVSYGAIVEGGIVDRATEREGQQRAARKRRGARDHLIMLLTKGASAALGASSRYSL